MLCDQCKRSDATVFITRIIDGAKQELHYCEKCAKQQDLIAVSAPFSSNHFLASLIDSVQNSALKVNYIKTTSCSKCGMTYGQFKQTGRLGCDECYQAFEEKLMPLIKRIHGYEHHTGKVPGRSSTTIKALREIEALKQELRDVLEHELYERAVEIRDKIREYETQIAQERGAVND